MRDLLTSKNPRRIFLRDSLLTTALVMSRLPTGASNKTDDKVAIGCAPAQTFQPTQTISSVKSGTWTDPATWGGTIPTTADTAVISSGHAVFIDSATISAGGVLVSDNARLVFDEQSTATLECQANVVVNGRLEMHPANPNIIHTLRFTGINENNFVGGGMNVLDSDVGLWVMGAGLLDIVGSPKTSWTSANGDVAKSATNVTVADAGGWNTGDEIVITPTEPVSVGSAFSKGFDEGTITAVSGPSVTFDKPTSRRHPVVNSQWTAEVLNLTRNARIEGTPTGRTHIFIRSTSIQILKFASLRYLGPRKDRNGDGIKELVAGRYGLHFHHCNDGSRNSVVIGNVIRDCGNHSYVPHISHGILFKDNVSYNTLETSFWWDPGDPTHDVIYDHNIVALGNYVNGARDMNAEDAPTFSVSGFALNTGDGNVCRNNVVVGAGMGDFADGGGYNWEAVINEGVWIFHDNIAHNNDCGIRIWQNSTRNHVIETYTAYHNKVGIFHGAYANSYTYIGGIMYANKLIIKAASVNSNRVRIENYTFDGAGVTDHAIELIHSPLPGERPILLRNIKISGCTGAAIYNTVEPEVHSADIVQCDIQGDIVVDPIAVSGETLRVQPVSGQPYMIRKSGRTNIPAFAPIVWGTGKGLKAEYFNGNNFQNPAFTRTDSNVSFSEWSMGVHYAITGTVYSVRWTGKIQPQYSEPYTFELDAGGGYRLWINNQLVLDHWNEVYPDSFRTAPINMQAGQLYDIKLEYFNEDKLTGAGLKWLSSSQQLEYVPQTQLYSDSVGVPEPNPDPDPNNPNPNPNNPNPNNPDPGNPGNPNNPDPDNPGHENEEEPAQRVNTIARDYIEVRSRVNTSFQLFDAGGKVLQRGKIAAGVNYIYVPGISRGVLFLNIINTPKAFRILKL